MALLAVLSITGVGLAQQAQTRKDRRAVTANQGQKYVDVDGLVYRSKETPAGTISTISGNVVFKYEDTTLRTDAATYNQRLQVATSPGKVQIDDSQNTVTGDRGVAHYRTRTAEITDNVRIIVRPRPQDRNAPEGSLRREFKDPVTVNCDKVLYNWRTRVANATGNLTLRQKDRIVTADRAVYEGRAERVTLTGNVRGVTTQGDEFRAPKAVVIFKEDGSEVYVEGPISGRFKIEEEEDPETTPPEPVTPGSPAPAAPITPPDTSPALPGAGPRP